MKTKHFYLFLLAFALTSLDLMAGTNPPLPTTAGMFLYIPGVTEGKGSAANNHVDEVEILAFSFGFTKGNVPLSFQDYAITKFNDGITPLIQRKLVEGGSFTTAELRIYKKVNGATVATIVSLTQFKGVVISSYASGGSGGELGAGCSTCSGLTENFTFSYSGIKIDNFTYNF